MIRRPILRQFVRFNSSKNVPGKPEPPRDKLRKQNEYVPPVQTHQRVSYEYPPPPDPEPFKPVEGTAYKKHLPLLAAIGGVVWAVYAYKHFISDDNGDEQQSHLDPGHFVQFKITYKQQISSDVALIELAPKYETFQRFIRQKGGLWNGKKLWSVDVKQPEIQVVRKYTPLPLYYQQYYDGTEQKALLRMIGKTEDEGRMTLMVKKYEDGEVSRYLHRLNVGDEVELRGPFVGYKLPYAPIDSTQPRDPMEDLPSRMLPEYALPDGIPPPDNVAFFAGGTGIAPILQSLLSHNPPRGKVDVYYSVRDRSEIPFPRFLLFLEKAGRAKFHYFVDNEKSLIKASNVPEPVARHYTRNTDPELDKEIEHELKLKKAMDEIRREKYGEPATTTTTTTTPDGAPEVVVPQVAEPTEKTPVVDKPVRVSGGDELGPRRKYRSILEQVADAPQDTTGPALAIVCGPDGYVNYMAGNRGLHGKNPIGGVLGEKKWDSTNAFRMES